MSRKIIIDVSMHDHTHRHVLNCSQFINDRYFSQTYQYTEVRLYSNRKHQERLKYDQGSPQIFYKEHIFARKVLHTCALKV